MSTVKIKEEKPWPDRTQLKVDPKHDIIDNEDGYKIRRNGISDYVCVYCRQAFIFVDQFRDHNSLRHSDEKPFHCHYAECNKSYVHRRNLQIHIERVHEKRKCYKCGFCDKEFYLKTIYTNHLRVHTGEKPYKCKYCSNRFKESGQLVYHEKVVHKKIKKYHCDYCCKRFGRPFELKVHIRTHTGEKPYKCEHCQKRYSRRSYLKKHKCDKKQ